MTSVLSVALLLIAGRAEIGPSLPPRTSGFIIAISNEVQNYLSQSKFQQAAAALEAWPSKEITYDANAIPAKYSGSVRKAVAMWEEASGNRLKIVSKKDGFVKFATVPFGTFENPVFRDGRVYAELPLKIGLDNAPDISDFSATWQIAKTFGFAAGLAPTGRRDRVTGVVQLAGQLPTAPALSPDISESSMLIKLIEIRETLNKAVKDKKPLEPAHAIISIDGSEKDAGIVTKGQLAKYQFTIANKGNVPLMLDFEVSCHCMIVSAPKLVLPGKDMILYAEIDTTDYIGDIDKSIQVISNDNQKPQISLKLSTKSVPVFRIVPDGVPVVALSDNGPTVYDVIAYSTGVEPEPFEIMNTQLSRPSIDAMVLPFDGDVTDALFGPAPIKRKGSLVRLTIPATQPTGLEFLRLIVITNLKSVPYADITLQLAKGIYAQPKSAYFASLAVGATDKRTVTIEHPSKAFAIKSLEVEGEGVSASVAPIGTSGHKYGVTVTVTAKAKGTLNGKVTVITDNPKYERIILPVTAIVE